VFGYHVTGSTGTLFLSGIVVGQWVWGTARTARQGITRASVQRIFGRDR